MGNSFCRLFYKNTNKGDKKGDQEQDNNIEKSKCDICKETIDKSFNNAITYFSTNSKYRGAIGTIFCQDIHPSQYGYQCKDCIIVSASGLSVSDVDNEMFIDDSISLNREFCVYEYYSFPKRVSVQRSNAIANSNQRSNAFNLVDSASLFANPDQRSDGAANPLPRGNVSRLIEPIWYRTIIEPLYYKNGTIYSSIPFETVGQCIIIICRESENQQKWNLLFNLFYQLIDSPLDIDIGEVIFYTTNIENSRMKLKLSSCLKSSFNWKKSFYLEEISKVIRVHDLKLLIFSYMNYIESRIRILNECLS